jgi:DNA adenine methylase
MNKNKRGVVKPLIKWTGGKYKEFKHFKHLIPDFDRYIEPFFGGGGVFFSLSENGNSIINDKSIDLINFYKQVSNSDSNFKESLYEFVNAWDDLKVLFNEYKEPLTNLFLNYRNQKISKDEISAFVDELLPLTKISKKYDRIFTEKFTLNPEELYKNIDINIVSKFSRIRSIEIKEGKEFTTNELYQHIETAIRSGFYMHFRGLLNQNAYKHIGEKMACWFLVRELCYGSMFRFNKKGEFNIPYGGIAYNKKSIKNKVDQLFSEDTSLLFKTVEIFNLDFEELFNEVEPRKGDFIFLDPPYDSEFSEYDNNSFTKRDQERLANCLYNSKAKWMLVIKNTDFIFNLYKKEGVFINSFDKQYTYNVRGRNNRDVEHLIITNYQMS